MNLEKLSEEVVELKTVLARIDERLKHMDLELSKVLTQTTLTNGRVTKLEKTDAEQLFNEIEDLKLQVAKLTQENNVKDTAKLAKKLQKEDWVKYIKWGLWVALALVYIFSNNVIRDFIKGLPR